MIAFIILPVVLVIIIGALSYQLSIMRTSLNYSRSANVDLSRKVRDLELELMNMRSEVRAPDEILPLSDLEYVYRSLGAEVPVEIAAQVEERTRILDAILHDLDELDDHSA